MKAEDISTILVAHCDLLTASDAKGEASQLGALAELLKSMGGVSIAALAARIDKSSVEGSNSLAGSATSLRRLATVLAAAKSKAAGDLESLADRLETSAAAVHAVLTKPVATRAKPKADDAGVKEHAWEISKALLASVEAPQRFESLVDGLAGDRSVTKAVLDQVAASFLGPSASYKSKKAILDAIRRKALRQRRISDHLDIIEKTGV